MVTVIPGADCFQQALIAGGEVANPADVRDAFQKIQNQKEKLQRAGDTTGMSEKLKAFAAREAERTRIAAAMARRHAALNVIVRDRLQQTVASHMRAGLNPSQALLAVLEGTQKGVENGRNSVAAMNLAYEARYIGGMLSEITRDRPHLMMALQDPKMDAYVMREMGELREGGQPGVTGNRDAQYVAKVFADYAELSRTDLNKLGASIGKLDGWAGPQSHDDIKMIAAGKDTWIATVRPLLDMDRTFPDLDAAEIDTVLGQVFDTITTGLPERSGAAPVGRVNPANMAKTLGKSRVLHFKNADAAMTYRGQFGYGNTVSGMLSHLRNASRLAGLMEVLGPNPENMMNRLTESVARSIRDSKIDATAKAALLNTIGLEGGQVTGRIRHALDIATGLASRPVGDGVNFAKISNDVRAVQSMAKLGGSVISSISDLAVNSAAAVFRGSGFFDALTTQLDGLRQGRPKGELAQISYLLGEGFDGLIGHIVAPAAAQDGPIGKLAALQTKFFKWNGQSWWTDVTRASAGRIISAEMGMRAKSTYGRLPPAYRHVLGLHGIDAARWNIIRAGGSRTIDGKSYITPDLIRSLDDSAFEPLVQGRLAKIKPDDPAAADKRASILSDARRDVELGVLRFFADETNYGLLETDARSRRTTTWGQRPGTAGGEAIRFVMQFKGFPVAFTQRVLGRAIYGHRKDAAALERFRHIGSLIAGTTIAGYMSMTLKDMMRGYWPPRNPADPKVFLAAMAQGGAAGLYGDFLFSQVNRFGGGVLETVAGPTLGSAADAIDTGLKARDAAIGLVTGQDAKIPAGDALNLALNNTPFINLFYSRPALDYLFINSLREAVSPGYLKRQVSNRKKEFGQTQQNPLGQLLGPSKDPFNATPAL